MPRSGIVRSCRILQLAGGLLVFALSGCTSMQGAVKAKDLDFALRAPPAHRVKALDLAKLGRPVESEPRIYPGDLLELAIADLVEESKTETIPVRVREDGTIQIPMLPPIPIETLTASESEQVVRVSYSTARILRSPQISVRVLEQKKNRVYVIGAVAEPGVYELAPGNSDLLSAIVEAGGLTDEASSIIEIRRRPSSRPRRKSRKTIPRAVASHGKRSGPGTASFDFVEVFESTPSKPREPGTARRTPKGVSSWRPRGHSSSPLVSSESALASVECALASMESDAIAKHRQQEGSETLIRLDLANEADVQQAAAGLDLRNGDIVSIEEKRFEPFFVSGAVAKPGEFEMPADRDIRVLEAIAMAGGVNKSSQPKNVLVVRNQNDGKKATRISVQIDRAKRYPEENIRLKSGDLVTVEEDVLSSMRGYIRDTLRFGASIPLFAL